ncbi:MAG TPA: TIGR00645 family protein [Pseudomonadales bacterium]
MSIENRFERTLFASRWLLVPFYVGLVISVLLLLFKFVGELLHLLLDIASLSESDVILGILTLVDLSLIANLLFIIIFSGYESFVSKINVDDHEDKPGWMGKVGFSALKIKVIGSIVAISAIELLKVYINVSAYSEHEVIWKVLIHLTFVVSGVLFALMDKLSSASH